MPIAMVSRRSAVAASLATGAAVAALMFAVLPRGGPCTAERCPVTTAAAQPAEVAAADAFVTGSARGDTTTTSRFGGVTDDGARPTASAFVRPIVEPPRSGGVKSTEPATGSIDPTAQPAETLRAAAAPAPVVTGPVGVSGRNPLDVSDTRDYAPSVRNDIGIALSMAAANELDSAAAELAMVTSTNADVRAFAEQMRRDHGAANVVLYEVARRMDATPAPADTRQMRREAGWEMRELSRKTGVEFDRAYIAGEVDTHRSALDKLDGDLIPRARNPELTQLLARLRPVVAAHLARAQEIQRALDGGR